MSLSPFLSSLAVLAGLICLVNLTFMLMVFFKGSLKKLDNALLFSLACSDLCVGVFGIPIHLICNVLRGYPDCQLCITSYLLNRFYFLSSAMHMFMVVLEIYIKILHPFWFQNNEFTVLRSVLIVPALWMISLVISAIPLSWLHQGCSEDTAVIHGTTAYTKYYDYAFMTLISAFLFLMIIAFVRIYLVVRTHLGDIRAITLPLNTSVVRGGPSNQTESDDLDDEIPEGPPRWETGRHDGNYVAGIVTQSSDDNGLGNACQKSRRYWMIKKARIIVRFGIMVFVYTLVWGTYVVISSQDEVGQEVNVVVQDVFAMTRFFTPLINPLIVTINNRDFQDTWVAFSSYFYSVVTLWHRFKRPSSSNSHGVESVDRQSQLVCTNTSV